MNNKTCKSCKHFECEDIGGYDGNYVLLCNRNEYCQYYLGHVNSLYDIDRDYNLEICGCYKEVE